MTNNRDFVEPTSCESYNKSGMFTVSPNATTVRYPTNPVISFTDPEANGGLNSPVDMFYIRNKSAAQIRVVVDGTASVSTGHIIDAGEDCRLPSRGVDNISVYGGDGTAIRVHWFAF